MSNRSPSVSPLASPLRRMQAAGLVGRINPYCSCRANFRNVKEVRACVSAFTDSTVLSKRIKSPPRSIFNIRTPPNKRSTHNAITPEARCMMKDAVAEFSSPLTDVKKIPIRESPIFPIPASKRRKLFDMRDSILKEVEMTSKMTPQKSEADLNTERNNAIERAAKHHYARINAEQELLTIQELYPDFKFSSPVSLKNKTLTDPGPVFDGEFLFSSTVSASLTKKGKATVGSQSVKVSPTTPGATDKSESTQNVPVVTVDKDLAARFRPPEGSWECEVCMINNRSDAVTCAACTTDRPASSKAQPQQPKVHVEADKELLERFRMPSDKWECDTCMIQNNQSDEKCVSCETAKPGSKPKQIDKVMANPLPLFTKAPTTNVFKLNPNIGSGGSSLFQGGLNIPGFSLNTNPSEPKLNLFKSFPLLPSKSTSHNILGLTTPVPITSSVSSTLVPLVSSAELPKSTPAISNPISSSGLTQVSVSAPLAVTPAPTSILQPPAVSIPMPFNVRSQTPLSKEDTTIITTTTTTITATTTTNTLIDLTQPIPPAQQILPFSPPRLTRGNPVILPITPVKSADDEAMEVIPFVGTLTTPVKGSSSLLSASPFSFQVKTDANPRPALPPSQPVIAQFGASSMQGFSATPFQLPKTDIPPSFQFGRSTAPPGTAQQVGTNDNPQINMFQFKGSSQPSVPFQATGGIAPQKESSSQPESTGNALFQTNQGQIMNNLFASQDKPRPSPFSLQTQQQQQQQQTPNFAFTPQVIPGPSMFKQEPNPNVFKPSNAFSPTQKPGFTFSAGGNTPQTASTGFPFSPAAQQLPSQQITPSTPQTSTFPNFNVGASQPSSDLTKRVIKTAKRRLPHK